ncbi:MAG: formylglycine-generating enzyme family protein [Planctomycetaceae bacterium]|nr:formylglycine-generating enzyme family protein [Planctomycetaceae bacterium]
MPTHAAPRVSRRLAALLLTLSPAFVAAPAQGQPKPAASGSPTQPLKATPQFITPAPAPGSGAVALRQPIPGAAFNLNLVLVPGSPDGAIKPFYITTTEITWEAYDAFVFALDEGGSITPPEPPPPGGYKPDPNAQPNIKPDAITRPSKPYIPPDRGFGHDGYAAISITAKGAQAFCTWLSARSGLTFRLPTEAEWRHAAAAGSTGEYTFGDDVTKLHEYAWFSANADDTPHPVGKKKPNPWGLFDVHGNIQEWVIGADGKPITKGGSYRDAPEKLALAATARQSSGWNASDPQIPKSVWWLSDGPFVGFRIICEVPANLPPTPPSTPAANPAPAAAPTQESRK